MANIFTRALDRITPWDRGGEVQRRLEKKKRDDEAAARRVVVPTVQTPRPTPQTPTVKQPTNVFDTLSTNFKLGEQNKPGVVPVFKTPDVAQPRVAMPGTVVQPTINTKPHDLGANIRYAAGAPAGVALGVLRAGTGLVQGTAELPSFISHAGDWLANKLTGNKKEINNPITKGVDKVTNIITKPLKWLGKKTDEAAIGFGSGSRATYKPAQVATNIATIVPGVIEGGAAVANKLSRAGKIAEESKVLGSLNKAKDIAESQRVSPILKAIDDATGGSLSKSKWLSKFMPKTEAPVQPNVVKVPVKRGVSVDEVIGSAEDIPVKVTPKVEAPKGPIIREIGGDATDVTRMPTPEEVANQRAIRNYTNQPTPRPDPQIEGVTPRTPEKLFTLTPEATATNQAKVVDDYADMLRGMGEGNGTQLIRDGEGGYTRTSNNFRPGDTGGKKMTKAAWREEAQRQLESGTAEGGFQKGFDDLADPEIQAGLARGEPIEPGQPISVKQIKGIDVVDNNTNMPQNLPEAPGQVRVTTATAPNNVKSEAIAAQTPPVAPVVAETNAIPTTPKQADEALDGAYERLVKSLKENQTAQRVEKKINSAEKSRRFAEKQRIYDELVASGVSRREAERQATASLAGKYTDNAVANFEVTGKEAENFRKAIDEVSDDPFNTKRAFEHLIDPTKTDPLQPWERTRIRRFVQKSLGEDAAQSLDEAIVLAEQTGDRTAMGRVADFMTSAIAAGDISATGRQGLFGLINHPGMSGQAFKEAMGALVDPKKYDDFARRLTQDADTAFIQENMAGKYLTLSDVADEARGASTTNKAIAWYVNPSNRHYNVYLDSLRHLQKKAIIERYGGQSGFLKAAEASGNSEKWMKAWGNVVDRMSGRGTFSNAGSPTVGDIQVLFSARNLASKFQRLTAPFQVGLLKTNPEAYLYQLREVAQPAAALGTALALVGASGLAEIENGKIKIGNTRIDITGGFATILNAMNNIRKAFTEESNSGFARTGWDVTKDFFQNQLSPVLGTIGQLMDIKSTSTGMKDRYGNEVDAKWLLEKAPIPAIAQTAIDSKTGGESWFQAAANVFSEGLGFGANTYQSADDKKAAAMGKDVYKNLQDTAKQLEKDGISTESGDVSNYVADGDYDKAERAIKYKLMEAQAEPDASPSKINKIENTLQEVQLRRDGVPIDDDEIQSTIEQGDYDSALQGLNHKLSGLEDSSDAKRKPVETDIKRLEVTRDGRFDPSIIKLYQNMSNAEWRKMGDPEDEDYNPDVYQALWAYDDAMATAGVSRSDFTPDKQKYSAKKTDSGSGSKKFSTDFGTLKAGSFTPKVQQYDTIDAKSGTIPIVRKVRPNIVHEVRGGR